MPPATTAPRPVSAENVYKVEEKVAADGSFYNDPLTSEELNERIVSGVGQADIPYAEGHKLHLNYAYVSQRGFYPEALDKENQDSFYVDTSFGNNARHALFGVFDGVYTSCRCTCTS